MRLATRRAIQVAILPLLVLIGARAEDAAAAGRHDRFSVGILAGSMFPKNPAYDTARSGLTKVAAPTLAALFRGFNSPRSELAR
jgi:hypothetical protein